MTISKALATQAGVASAAQASITSAAFNSTGYTHLAIFCKQEGVNTTQTPSDNKGSTGWTSLAKQANQGANSWGQIHWVKIGTPGTGHTVTTSFSPNTDWPYLAVWLVNATSGNMELAHATPTNAQANANGTSTRPDGGTLTTDRESVSFMGIAEFTVQTYTNAPAGWTIDYNGSGGATGSGALSRADAAGGTFDPSCDQTNPADWAVVSASFGELSGGASVVMGNPLFSLTNPQFLAGIAVTRAELLNPKAWF